MRTAFKLILAFMALVFAARTATFRHLIDNVRNRKAGADSLPRADRDWFRPKDPEITAGTRVTASLYERLVVGRHLRKKYNIKFRAYLKEFGVIGALAGFFNPSGGGEHVYQEFARTQPAASRVRPYAAGPDDDNDDGVTTGGEFSPSGHTATIEHTGDDFGDGGGTNDTNDTGEPTSNDNHWPPPAEEEFASDGDEEPKELTAGIDPWTECARTSLGLPEIDAETTPDEQFDFGELGRATSLAVEATGRFRPVRPGQPVAIPA